jgi:N-acetylglucosamine-6-phosphate deacetylase
MSSPIAVTADRIFTGSEWLEDTAIVIQDDRIVELTPATRIPTGVSPIDFGDCFIAPGFIDLQVNGGGGVRFGDETSPDAIAKIAAAHAKFGTTKLLPTLITDTFEATARALEGGLEAHNRRVPGFLGLHLEGPHLSLNRKGAHNPSFIRPMTGEDLKLLCDYRSNAGFLLTTVAPENVTTQQVRALAEAGVIISIGHSDASSRTVKDYFDAGASMVTHLFNAMSQLGNREPGIVGAALSDGRISAGLIADGIHVDPDSLKIALRAKVSPGEIFLVTDAMQTIGTDLSSFQLNGRAIQRSEGSLRLEDGTLAGADVDMLSSVRYIHERLGLPLAQALSLASTAPAKSALVDHSLGYLKRGFVADFVVLSQTLDWVATWIDGRPIKTA